MMKRLLIVGFALVGTALSGCTTPKYACGAPGGVGCKSVQEVYQLSNSGQLKITKALPEGEDSEEKWQEDAKAQKVSLPLPDPVSKPQTVYGNNKIGLRSSERKLRIWISPWEDAEQDFHDEQFVYTIVEEGEWIHKENKVAEENAMATTGSPRQRGFLGQ